MLKCDHCDNEATVHEVTLRGGVRFERHLCEQCARNTGLTPQHAASLSELLPKSIAAQAVVAPAAAAVCPACKMTFAEFKQTERVGCPECYKAFESQLAPLLERAHEGGTHHCGKLPASMRSEGMPASDRAERLGELRRQLEDAVAAEQYERAASIRDEIRRVAGSGPRAEQNRG